MRQCRMFVGLWVTVSTLAAPSAALASHAHVATQPAAATASSPAANAVTATPGSSESPSGRTRLRAPRKPHNARQPAPKIERIVVREPSGRRADAEAKAQQAAAAARAQRLYESSQTSAPIIPHATACKRVGADGESIYENC